MCLDTATDRHPSNESPSEAGRMARAFSGPVNDMNAECLELARRVRGMAWAFERIARDEASMTDPQQNLAILDLSVAVLDYVDRCMKDLEAEAERRMARPQG